ncbi:hypothetical protein [Marivita sp.]|uniref:hypothetical protein n=1 Tax=Marivita sp. TaxID=2003365 RepID=UPI003B51896B
MTHDGSKGSMAPSLIWSGRANVMLGAYIMTALIARIYHKNRPTMLIGTMSNKFTLSDIQGDLA